MSNIITTLLSALLATAAALGVVTAIMHTSLGQTITGHRSAAPAHSNHLFNYIAKVDHLVAKLFYWLIITVGFTLLLIALLDTSGLFEYISWL